MATVFGDRLTFAVEVGDQAGPNMRAVDIWAAGTRMSVHDNCAYVPSLTTAMRRTAERVRRREVPPCPFPDRSPEAVFARLERDKTALREQFWFGPWDEIIDDTSNYAYLDTELILVFSFRRPDNPDRGKTFTARIQPDDFVTTTLAAADFLDADRS